MAMAPIYLTEEEREYVIQFIKKGTHSSRLITRANILLTLDRTGKKDHMRIKRTADTYCVSRQAVYNIIEDFHNAETIEAFLQRKPRETPPVAAKITGDVEAKIIALACSEPPEGYAKWTLRLLANKAIELDFIDSLSYVSVRSLLKKRNISLT